MYKSTSLESLFVNEVNAVLMTETAYNLQSYICTYSTSLLDTFNSLSAVIDSIDSAVDEVLNFRVAVKYF